MLIVFFFNQYNVLHTYQQMHFMVYFIAF